MEGRTAMDAQAWLRKWEETLDLAWQGAIRTEREMFYFAAYAETCAIAAAARDDMPLAADWRTAEL